MVRRLLVAAAGVMLLSQVVPTSAGAAFEPCNHADNTVVTLGGQVYLDIRYVGEPYGEMLWVYAEDNDVDDLQRGGKALVAGHSEQCPDPTTRPDRLIY